jgi:hypothetical protein
MMNKLDKNLTLNGLNIINNKEIRWNNEF